MAAQQKIYIGLMSGTSMDGVDAALVDVGQAPFKILDCHYQPYSLTLRNELIKICTAHDRISLDQYAVLDHKLGLFLADMALTLIQRSPFSADNILGIGSHGQTIRHQPPGNQNNIPYTLQIGDPNIIAEKTDITTVADFRRRDLAAGGHGAPLAPAFHVPAFHSKSENRVILNLGGVANITILPKNGNTVTGFDTGPANALMDQWAHKHFDVPYDSHGERAARGNIDPELLSALLKDPYFQRLAPKSTGPEYFNLHWFAPYLSAASPTTCRDNESILATLNALTAHSVANAIKQNAANTNRILVCGGGIHNDTLITHLKKLLPQCNIGSTADFGIDPDYVEAAAFAWLAKQTLEGRSGNLPAVTGATSPVILGAIYARNQH